MSQRRANRTYLPLQLHANCKYEIAHLTAGPGRTEAAVVFLFLAAGKTLCKEPNAFLMAGPCETFAAV